MELRELHSREENNMKKIFIVTAIIIALGLSSVLRVKAMDINPQKLSINILSPNIVKAYPGKEEVIKVQIKNNTDNPIHDLLVYITMADIKKNMTVNLEDYSADKPSSINIIQPGETKTVELPIRFVYTSNYYLYSTVVSKEFNNIASSTSIPIEIMGNTRIDKNMVVTVSYIEPVLLALGSVFLIVRKRFKHVV